VQNFWHFPLRLKVHFLILRLSCDSRKSISRMAGVSERSLASRPVCLLLNFYLFCFISIYSCKSVDFLFSSARLLRQWNKNADACSCTNTSISICICIFGRSCRCRCICIFGTAATTVFISMFLGSVLLLLSLSDLSERGSRAERGCGSGANSTLYNRGDAFPVTEREKVGESESKRFRARERVRASQLIVVSVCFTMLFAL